ncbi:hypothetical protein AB9E28_35475, partial [Rhizobium leguminosarum]
RSREYRGHELPEAPSYRPKTRFGLAHLLAEAAICIAGDEPQEFSLTQSFAISSHIAVASR